MVCRPASVPISTAKLDKRSAYSLIGARLLNYMGSKIALVVYETRNRKISLLVAPAERAVVAGGDQVRSSGWCFTIEATQPSR
jgi:hypothetical protein